MSVLGKLLAPMFQVAPEDLPERTRGEDATTERLQHVVFTVTECCQQTLLWPGSVRLVPKLDAYPEELRGFAYEGAGVGLAALDQVLPYRRRTRDFVTDPAAAPYRYAVYLGAGMGLARLGRHPERFRRRLEDPVFSWVVLDGYGFHEGFFAHRRHVQEQALPRNLTGYSERAFDHGLGRSIWFASGGSPTRIPATIGAFREHRRGDLWAGIGLACGYTGGVERAAVELLRDSAGAHLPRFAEGVVVAAKNRHGVGNAAEHNDMAARVVCGADSHELAALADDAMVDLPLHDVEPAYEVWRRRIRSHFCTPVPDGATLRESA